MMHDTDNFSRHSQDGHPDQGFHPIHGDEEDPDSPEAFVRRAAEAFSGERTQLDRLLEVYEAEGANSEHFATLLDDLAYESLEQHPDFIRNAQMVHNDRLSKADRQRYRDAQKELFLQQRQAIIEAAGLPTELAISDIEKARQNVKKVVRTVITQSNGEVDPGLILRSLRILRQDGEGRDYFAYPQGLFPQAVDRQWEVYLESVRHHLRIKRNVEMGVSHPQEMGDADRARRIAHNAVTRSIDRILGLDGDGISGWDFEKSRNLVAKMRDSRYPTIETSEMAVTERAVAEAVAGMHAVRALSKRLSDFHQQ